MECMAQGNATHMLTMSVFCLCLCLCLCLCMCLRPWSFLGADFRLRIHPFVWCVPLAPNYSAFLICTTNEWAGVDIRWFPVDGIDTRWIPRSLSCGFVYLACVHTHALSLSLPLSQNRQIWRVQRKGSRRATKRTSSNCWYTHTETHTHPLSHTQTHTHPLSLSLKIDKFGGYGGREREGQWRGRRQTRPK